MSEQNATIRVLVVDDQEHVRGWVRTILERAGITQITEAGSGHEALRLVTAPGAEFDLVLCDLRMPDGDGIELIRDFSKLAFPTAVAILSVEEERLIETAGIIAEERGLRVLGVIQKPLTTEKLDGLLAQLRQPEQPAAPAPTVPFTAEEIEAALQAGQMRMVYQPRIRMRSGEFVGVEGFVRWHHPKLGIVMPEDFLSVVESSSSLNESLTIFVLSETIACAGRWKAVGRELPVSINLSSHALESLDLPEQLEKLCITHQVPPEWVTLELAEHLIAADSLKFLDIAARLRLKSFRLSIDNFGVGISGMQQMQRLQRLPFSEIKIDRQFVQGCATSPAKRAVVEATISLAHSLRLLTVAEGVQNRPEWVLLDELGCSDAQGYFVARPLGEEGLEAWAMQWLLHRK